MVCEGCHRQGVSDAKYCSGCGQPFVAAPYAYQANRLYRPRHGRVLAGVCAGFAERYGWDPILVRLALLAVVLFGCGSGVLFYIAAWIVMPNGPLMTTMPPAGPSGPVDAAVVA